MPSEQAAAGLWQRLKPALCSVLAGSKDGPFPVLLAPCAGHSGHAGHSRPSLACRRCGRRPTLFLAHSPPLPLGDPSALNAGIDVGTRPYLRFCQAWARKEDGILTMNTSLTIGKLTRPLLTALEIT
jgi:hypothetical protein